MSFAQNIPTIGNSDKLEIANWNIEWFGNATNGPVNKTLQFNNVKTVLQKSKIDIWGLSEISNDSAFYRLLDSLPKYKGVLNPLSVTQKTALIYDSSLFSLVYAKSVLTSFSYDFASGRFPFEIALIPKFGNLLDTHIFIVVHLKANVGTLAEKQTSLDRRTAASVHLKKYIDSAHFQKKVMVLGDFNDDTDVSIFNSKITPFVNFLLDTINFRFLTLQLSEDRVASTVSYPEMIDHQIISNEWYNTYESNSCRIIKLSDYITSFGTNTSDHFPVLSTFVFEKNITVKSINKFDLTLYPNPVNKNQIINFPPNAGDIKFFDLTGKQFYTGINEPLSIKSSGFYIITFKIDGKQFQSKLNVLEN